MSAHVLARKWRPRRFEEVMGQDHVVRALQYSVLNEKFHHAYLLTGTRGVGKTTLARILAKSANCLSENLISSSAEPCGTCTNCLAIDNNSFPDLLEIDAATNTSVDAMRTLLETVVYPPYMGKKKVYVIDEVHMLSTSAFNAMLKSLEEPPTYLIFVLATTDPQKVPITVLSRCLQFNLKSLPESLLIQCFSTILTQEKVDFDAPALSLIARAANGSVRDGLSLMDQLIAQGSGSIRENTVQEILGIVTRQWTGEVLVKIADRQAGALAAMTAELEANAILFDEALAELSKTILALQIVQLGGDFPEEIDKKSIEPLVERFSSEELQLMYQIALNGRRDLSYAPDSHSGFLMTLLRMMAFMPAEPPPITKNSPHHLPVEKKKHNVHPTTSGSPLSDLKEREHRNDAPLINNGMPKNDLIQKNNEAEKPMKNTVALPSTQQAHSNEFSHETYTIPDVSDISDTHNTIADFPEDFLEKMPEDTARTFYDKSADDKTSFRVPIIDSPPQVIKNRWSFLVEKDWPDQVTSMDISAPLRRIAHYSTLLTCEEKPIEDDTEMVVTMALDEREKYLLDMLVAESYFNILQAYFSDHAAGKNIRFQCYLAPLSENTVAYRQQHLQKMYKQAAHQAIENHPLVQVLQKKYQADILEDSLICQ